MSFLQNKENQDISSGLSSSDYSPTSIKKALKAISPNKAPTGVGRLKFLENDNIDEHFAFIHSSNEQIQQQLHNLDARTKQTGADLSQLCDRSKNNNHFLNTLLQNLANYSNEVITEGNATKHDIEEILKRLDINSDQVQKLSSGSNYLVDNSGFEDEFRKVETTIQTEVLKAINASKEVKTSLDCLNLNVTNNDLTNELKNIIETNNEQIIKLWLSGEKHLDLNDIVKATQAVIKDSLIPHFFEYFQQSLKPEVFKFIQENIDTTINKTRSEQFKDLSAQVEKNHDKQALNSKEVLQALDNIASNLPERGIVKQIVDPIVAELKSVSLDNHSQTLLQSILVMSEKENNDKLKNQENQKISIHKLDEVISALSLIRDDKSILTSLEENFITLKIENQKSNHMIERNHDLLQSIDSSLQNNNKNLESLNENINEQVVKVNEIAQNNRILDLEKKIATLEGKYDQLCRSYEEKYDDLKKLQDEFKSLGSKIKDFNQINNNNNNNNNTLLKLRNVRHLHSSKMSDIEGNYIDNFKPFNKRIVSTPIALMEQQEKIFQYNNKNVSDQESF